MHKITVYTYSSGQIASNKKEIIRDIVEPIEKKMVEMFGKVL